MTSAGAAASRICLSPHVRTQLIFGANTDVGKTIVSAGMARASLQSARAVNYIKPLQCGGSDDGFVKSHIGSCASSNSSFKTQVLFHWDTFASPHVASRIEDHPVSDTQVVEALQTSLYDITKPTSGSTITLIETAGGVQSPSSASPDNTGFHHAKTNDNTDTIPTKNGHWGWSTQADLYQCLRGMAPVVLVGDGRLGGISATITALESLLIRGYTIAGLVLLEDADGFNNATALREYASTTNVRKLVQSSSSSPLLGSDWLEQVENSVVSLPPIPPEPEPLHGWYESKVVTERLQAFDEYLQASWERQFTQQSANEEDLWWDFAQAG